MSDQVISTLVLEQWVDGKYDRFLFRIEMTHFPNQVEVVLHFIYVDQTYTWNFSMMPDEVLEAGSKLLTLSSAGAAINNLIKDMELDQIFLWLLAQI